MATTVSLTYRCRLDQVSSDLPVFVDLASARSGPPLGRVALGRLLTVPRLTGSPIQVVVNDVHDLADPLDQQLVAELLAPSGSRLVVAGATVQPDSAVIPVHDELRQIANVPVWFVPADPDEEDPRHDVRDVIQALVVGLEILPSQAAALLNAIPAWAERSSAPGGFNRQSINHFVSRQAGPPTPPRWPDSALTIDNLGELEDIADAALPAYGYMGVFAALKLFLPNGAAGLTGAQQAILSRIVERSGGQMLGASIPEIPDVQRRILDRGVDFALDVVQGRFLDRALPARNLSAAQRMASGLSTAGSNVRSIASALNSAGYLTVRTIGTWSTSTVTSLLASDVAPVRQTDRADWQ